MMENVINMILGFVYLRHHISQVRSEIRTTTSAIIEAPTSRVTEDAHNERSALGREVHPGIRSQIKGMHIKSSRNLEQRPNSRKRKKILDPTS